MYQMKMSTILALILPDLTLAIATPPPLKCSYLWYKDLALLDQYYSVDMDGLGTDLPKGKLLSQDMCRYS